MQSACCPVGSCGGQRTDRGQQNQRALNWRAAREGSTSFSDDVFFYKRATAALLVCKSRLRVGSADEGVCVSAAALLPCSFFWGGGWLLDAGLHSPPQPPGFTSTTSSGTVRGLHALRLIARLIAQIMSQFICQLEPRLLAEPLRRGSRGRAPPLLGDHFIP